jgi:hypothetical protein
MIPPVPPNFGFSLLAIPVWRWEETPAPPSDAPTTSGGESRACSADTGGDVPAASSLDKRLVFVGYEWHSAVEWRLFPDAPWDHGFEDHVGDIRDSSLRRELEQQRDQQNALARLQSQDARTASQRCATNPADGSTVAAPPPSSTD